MWLRFASANHHCRLPRSSLLNVKISHNAYPTCHYPMAQDMIRKTMVLAVLSFSYAVSSYAEITETELRDGTIIRSTTTRITNADRRVDSNAGNWQGGAGNDPYRNGNGPVIYLNPSAGYSPYTGPAPNSGYPPVNGYTHIPDQVPYTGYLPGNGYAPYIGSDPLN